MARLLFLGQRELWLDELFSYAFAITPRSEIFWPSTTLPHAPLYFLLISFLPADASDIAFRLPSVLFGITTVGILTHFVIRRRGIREGGLVGLLLALNPLAVYWSREVRMYALYGLLVTLMILLVLSERLSFWGWMLLPAAAFYTFPYAIFYFPWLLWEALRRRWKERAVPLLCGFGIVLLWLLPALYYSRSHPGAHTFDRLTPHTAIVFLKQSLAGNALTTRPRIRLAILTATALGSAGLLFLLGGLREKKRSWERRLFVGALSPLAFYYPVQFFIDSGFTYRAFFPSSLLLVLLSGLGLAKIKVRFLRWIVLGGMLLSYLWILSLYFQPAFPYNWNTPRTRRYAVEFSKLAETNGSEAQWYFRTFPAAMAAVRYAPPSFKRKFLDPEIWTSQLLPMEREYFGRFFQRQGIIVGVPKRKDGKIVEIR